MWILLIILVVVTIFILCKIKFKRLKLPNITLITGAVGSGKTRLAVYLSRKKYRQVHRRWWWKSRFQKLFRKEISEEPRFYSNIPVLLPEKLRSKFSLMSNEIMMREKRVPYKSVFFFDEIELMADSMMFKSDYINDNLTFWWKLFRHITKGGFAFCTSQVESDNHFTFKRSISQFLWIHSSTKFIPFVSVYKVVELVASEELGGGVSQLNGDVEDHTKVLLVPKRTHKYYDTYAYSVFTDDLEKDESIYNVDEDDLKAKQLVTMRRTSYLWRKKGEIKDEKIRS